MSGSTSQLIERKRFYAEPEVGRASFEHVRLFGGLLLVFLTVLVACGADRGVARSEDPKPTSRAPAPSAPTGGAPATSVEAPAPSSSASRQPPAECSQALLASVLEPDRIVSATPDPVEGRIINIACTRGEADEACRKRAEAEALRDASRGTKAIASVVGEGSPGETIELVVDVDGSEQRWSVRSMQVADKRLQELAASGRRVTVKSARRPAGRRATIMLKPPEGAPRVFSATLVVRSSDDVDAEIVNAARAKRVEVRAARKVDDKTWEVEVACKVEQAGGAEAR
jgi:hypothetical protein